jgi:hypothetical protein
MDFIEKEKIKGECQGYLVSLLTKCKWLIERKTAGRSHKPKEIVADTERDRNRWIDRHKGVYLIS